MIVFKTLSQIYPVPTNTIILSKLSLTHYNNSLFARGSKLSLTHYNNSLFARGTFMSQKAPHTVYVYLHDSIQNFIPGIFLVIFQNCLNTRSCDIVLVSCIHALSIPPYVKWHIYDFVSDSPICKCDWAMYMGVLTAWYITN